MGTTAPILGNKYWPTSASDKYTRLSNFAFHQSMDLIMEEFWELNHRGFYAMVGGVEKLVVPCLVAVATDLDEAWKVACRPKNGLHCHLNLHISKEDYCDPNASVNSLLILL